MQYYLLKADETMHDKFIIIDFFYDSSNVKSIKSKGDFLFPDIFLQKQLFDMHYLLSDKLKQIIEIYNERTAFTPILLSDKANKTQKLYWDISLPVINCLDSKKTKDFKTIHLYSDILYGKTIFFVLFVKAKYLIVRDDLLESILRRYPIGLQYTKVSLLGGV